MRISFRILNLRLSLECIPHDNKIERYRVLSREATARTRRHLYRRIRKVLQA